jgi:hypothetical protein
VLAAAPLLAGCVAVGWSSTPGGPASSDVPGDPAFPAALEFAAVESGGEALNGIVYVAPGPGPHPVAVLLHGFPGNERNLDLGQALRRAGWTVLFFHYRGAFGSGGDFSFTHVLEDAAAAVRAAGGPAFAASHRADPERVVLVGHSMGGFAALHAGADLPEVDCVVSIAGANLGAAGAGAAADPAFAAGLAAAFDAWRAPLRGTTGAALVAELAESAARFDLVARAPVLAAKPVLLVAGTRDIDTPPAQHHVPVASALRAAGAAQFDEWVIDADHAFSDHRIALARAVTGWLAEHCR